MGLNQDESDRTVFDGLIPHVADGKHGEFNHRFAQPSSQASRSPNNLPPFSDIDQTDPETGQITAGLLHRLAATGQLPKVMHTYTSSEYWGGHGALVHIDLSGTGDLEIPREARVYHFSGCQHPLGTFPLSNLDPVNGHQGQQGFNWVDYRPLLRAALVNLDRWVTLDTKPPDSKYPRLDQNTAVPPESLTGFLASIPGLNFPQPLRRFTRLDFGPEPGIATNAPPIIGKPYPLLVPALDSDGNERAGVALPFHTVSLATYTGWNMRDEAIGGSGQILSSGGASGGTLLGSTIPFPFTRAERQATGDPRPSIEERYTSREAYLEVVRKEADTMLEQRYILPEDVATILEQAGEHYRFLENRVPATQAADD